MKKELDGKELSSLVTMENSSEKEIENDVYVN